MSTALPDRPTASPKAQNSAFAIVVSRYNRAFTQALADNARDELLAIDPGSRIEIFEVPGAFEIPLIVKLIAERGEFQAILALGVIIKGETAHADLIAGSITESLLKTSTIYDVPVIHEVLLVATEAQAQARCLDPDLNRGTEAARTAVEAVRAVQSVAAIHQSPVTSH